MVFLGIAITNYHLLAIIASYICMNFMYTVFAVKQLARACCC